MSYFIIIILVAFSSLFSGLTIGFFSLNRDDLKRRASLGDKKAQKIYSVRKRGYLLLCTLLIGNVAVNSVLSIFLGSLTTGVAAWITSTSLIVLFGEIIPQAIFARYALNLGARLVWVVKIFIFIFYPICWPLSWTLFYILGKEPGKIYSKQELVKIIEDHEDLGLSGIDADEEKIVRGALSFSEKQVKEIMTPIDKTQIINGADILNFDLLKKINQLGHSRFPVYAKNKKNIIGILYAKDIVGNINKNQSTVKEIMRLGIVTVSEDTRLDDLLNSFKKSRRHLYLVTNKDKEVRGIVTIEDVLEEIIGDEIIDEYD